MSKGSKILLILIAVVCFGIALSYPIRYELETKSNERTMERLTELRKAGLEKAAMATAQPEGAEPEPEQRQDTVTIDETPNAEAAADPFTGTAPPTREADDNGQSGTAPENPAPTAHPSENRPEDASGMPNDASGINVPAGTQPVAIQSPGQGPADVSMPQNTPQGESSQPVQTAGQGAQATPDAGEKPADASADASGEAPEQSETIATPAPTAEPTATPSPSPTPDRTIRSGALPYPLKEKVELDESRILPQYRDLYEINHDFVGWITIEGTDIDYPVVQNEINDYYLHRDFFGEENKNGQIILDALCDPYTPSYNLIISGHNMRNESMFSKLVDYYRDKDVWAKHKFVQFDSLMEERMYVVIAAFFAVDYAIYDDGFRYNADIQYRVDAEMWLDEVRQYQLYKTGIDAEFGDEFLTLTTCNNQRRKNGRFVVICRRLREGETIE